MNPIDDLWQLIVDAAGSAQILDGPHCGLVKNSVINDFYHRETAFAAKIFAVEWRRTKNSEYQRRAELALKALEAHLKTHPINRGVDEPTLTPRGLRYRRGSIPATILLVFAAKDAASMLRQEFKVDAGGLRDYLATCDMGNGKYYHDAIAKGNVQRLPHVVNTSAMAYLFYAYLLNGREERNLVRQRIEISQAIVDAQRSDGFWPYLDTGAMQRVFYAFDKILPGKIKAVYNSLLLDRSIYFGDGVHHCITLYYLLKGAYVRSEDVSSRVSSAILKGWRFLRRNLIIYDNNHVRFNFQWEPRPRHFRHCNFIDTSTYFYIFDILHELRVNSLISSDEAQHLSEGMARHILKALVLREGVVDGYEGPDTIKDLILPRPSESIFDKGFFISNTVVRGELGVV